MRSNSMTMQQDESISIKGFKVLINTGGVTHEDTWETCTGGSLNIEIGDSSTGGDSVPAPRAAGTNAPGHKYIEEVKLRGPMTASRRWIGKLINDTVPGKSPRFDLTIVEINKDGSDGRRLSYSNCFLTGYVFPALSASGTGNLYEEVSIKPERLELA
jgi:hypothetical protein